MWISFLSLPLKNHISTSKLFSYNISTSKLFSYSLISNRCFPWTSRVWSNQRTLTISTFNHFSCSLISNCCFPRTSCVSSNQRTSPTRVYKDFDRDNEFGYQLWGLVEEEHGKLNLKDVGVDYPYKERPVDDEFEFDHGDLNSYQHRSDSESDCESQSDLDSDSNFNDYNYSDYDYYDSHILLKKINDIDIKLEEALCEYDQTFGEKRKLVGKEIRHLMFERTSLTHYTNPSYVKEHYGVALVDVYRTCKETKGKQIMEYTAVVTCGDHSKAIGGQVGIAKAKGPILTVAQEKAYKRCFQQIHSVPQFEFGSSIDYPCQGSYKNTKVYLWPGSLNSGRKACRTIRVISALLGYRYIISKVVGSKNPYNIVKAMVEALNEY